MLLAALSTGHKVGLGLAVAVFVGFSLVVSMLVPRYRPQFPGRGLGVFLAAITLLFIGMLAAVEVFAKESEEEARAERPAATETTAPTTTATTTTTVTTTAAAPQSVGVTETEFKIQLDESSLSAGRYTFEVKNDGRVPHDFVIEGNGVDEKTTTLDPGGSDSVTADLKPGTYQVYCSIPGHKEAGMELKLTVSQG